MIEEVRQKTLVKLEEAKAEAEISKVETYRAKDAAEEPAEVRPIILFVVAALLVFSKAYGYI